LVPALVQLDGLALERGKLDAPAPGIDHIVTQGLFRWFERRIPRARDSLADEEWIRTAGAASGKGTGAYVKPQFDENRLPQLGQHPFSGTLRCLHLCAWLRPRPFSYIRDK
jgi:hypothetical protein